jgi:hypothetical protein
VKFAKLNKQNTIKSYMEQCASASQHNLQDVVVRRIVVMLDKEFEHVSNNLLESHDCWIEKTETVKYASGSFDRKVGIGGTSLSASTLKELGWEELEDIDILNDDRKLKTFHKYSRAECVLITTRAAAKYFFVDTQQYDYARYVGL